MPTFPTSGPTPVVVDLPVGSLRLFAGERDEVVVTVLPADPAQPRDVRATQEVHVERLADSVSITGPRWKQFLPFTPGSATVTVELPAGSDLSGTAGRLSTEGPLGSVAVTISAGDARIDQAARLELTVVAGSVAVGRVTGATAVKVSAGSVRVLELAGNATIRSTTGSTSIGSVTGSLHLSGAHGDVVVGRVAGDLTAKVAYAGIRVERVESGTVTLSTSYGSIEVGVPEGTAAWLDVASRHGTVRNELRPTDGPEGGTPTAQVRASTGYGDVVVRRP